MITLPVLCLTQQGAMVDLPLVNQQNIPVELTNTGHNTSGWVDDMDNVITSPDNVTNGPGRFRSLPQLILMALLRAMTLAAL